MLVAHAPDVDPERLARLLETVGEGLWHYRELLPPVPNVVSLGEGGTPLLECPTLSEELGLAEFSVKNEIVNPTLSFKDRAIGLGVALARGYDAPGVVAASTGNTAVSAAAYSARAGLPCRLFCASGEADSDKVATARVLGAEVNSIEGDFSSAHAAAAAEEDAAWFPLTTTYRNPYLPQAHRTVAFELFRQVGGDLPDWILVPVGAGPLLYGMYRGLVLLREAGLASRVPRLVAVQADACSPIADAWLSGTSTVETGTPQPTVAGAIADPLRGYEDEGALTLSVVQETNGAAVAVPEEDIVAATREFSNMEGLFLEPAAAATLPALRSLIREGTLTRESRVVAIATGHGIKDLSSIRAALPTPSATRSGSGR